jgi:hypothetical protein
MIPLLTIGSTVICPHAGQAMLFTTNTDALIDGVPALLQTDQHPVVGCTFAPVGVYTPCVLIRWVTGATQTNVHGVPVLLQTSIGICHNAAQLPQGVAVVVQTQQRALGI